MPIGLIAITLALGCGTPGGGGIGYTGSSGSGGVYTPPDRPHNIKMSEDGVTGMHARGYETPYLCLDASGSSAACPDDHFPEVSQLSCDSAGCHGSYDYDPATAQADRDLLGSAGPSCYDCHEREWSNTKDGTGGGSGGEAEDDD